MISKFSVSRTFAKLKSASSDVREHPTIANILDPLPVHVICVRRRLVICYVWFDNHTSQGLCI